MKKNMTFAIDPRSAEKFKKRCLKKGLKQSVVVNKLMDEWINNNITV